MKTIELKGGHRVRLLTVRHVMEVGETYWTNQRKQLLEDLDSQNASQDKRIELVREHSGLRGSSFLLLRMTFQLAEADALIRIACEAAGVPYEDATEGMTPDDRTTTAQLLLGFDPKRNGRTPDAAAPTTP